VLPQAAVHGDEMRVVNEPEDDSILITQAGPHEFAGVWCEDSGATVTVNLVGSH
jgi:hypothetical protein